MKETLSQQETLSQMVDRLMRDHKWDRYTALCAAEYYTGTKTWMALRIAVGRAKADHIGNMR